MNKLMKSCAVALVVGITAAVAVVGSVAPSGATESSFKFRQVQDLRKMLAAVFSVSSGHDHDGVTSKRIHEAQPATETVAAGETIEADACGGLKKITAASAVTTDTSNTFRSTSTLAAGDFPCYMDVVNVGPAVITLDFNVDTFHSAGGANVVLGSSDTVRVVAMSGFGWTQVGATGNN